MSLETLRQTMTQLFITVMTADHPTVTLTYDNVRYDNPRTGEWVHFSIMPDTQNRANLGTSPTFRQRGTVLLQVMGKEESGTATLYSIVDSILLGLGDKNVAITDGSAHTYGGMINNRGIIEGWHTFEIQIEYKYDAQS